MKWPLRRRRELLEQSEKALQKSERLAEAIELHVDEGQQIAQWARETLERNGLANLLFRAEGGH